MPAPLEGIRVLDFSTMVSGPVAARMLGDQGADVIKVESPKGDEMRRIGNQRNGLTAGFMSCNRGKRGICLDLKAAADQEKLRDLIATTDVIIQNFRRERTGQGEHIRLSMLDAMVSFFWPEGMSGITFVGDEIDVTKYQGTMDLIYETQTGYITAGAVSDAEWRGMCNALDKLEWIEDERFRDTASRFKNAELRKQLTAAEIGRWDRDDILERLDAEGVPSAPLLTRLDLLEDEQIKINGTIEIYEWEGHGQIRQAAPAARFERSPHEITRAAPLLGEHNDEVFAELAAAKHNA